MSEIGEILVAFVCLSIKAILSLAVVELLDGPALYCVMTSKTSLDEGNGRSSFNWRLCKIAFDNAVVEWLIPEGRCIVFSNGSVEKPSTARCPGSQDALSLTSGDAGISISFEYARSARGEDSERLPILLFLVYPLEACWGIESTEIDC